MTDRPVNLTIYRYRKGDRYVPRAGPHRHHVVEVAWVWTGLEYDLVQSYCACGPTWRFLHHHRRWT